VFSPADFSRPTPPPPRSWLDNRAFGAALVLVAVVLLVVLTVSYDQAVFIPFNATHAVTQTWQAQQPPTLRSRPRTRTPQPTRRRDNSQQAAQAELPAQAG
jgi:hypothetical protein